jgi:hypothetical protein
MSIGRRTVMAMLATMLEADERASAVAFELLVDRSARPSGM